MHQMIHPFCIPRVEGICTVLLPLHLVQFWTFLLLLILKQLAEDVPTTMIIPIPALVSVYPLPFWRLVFLKDCLAIQIGVRCNQFVRELYWDNHVMHLQHMEMKLLIMEKNKNMHGLLWLIPQRICTCAQESTWVQTSRGSNIRFPAFE